MTVLFTFENVENVGWSLNDNRHCLHFRLDKALLKAGVVKKLEEKAQVMRKRSSELSKKRAEQAFANGNNKESAVSSLSNGDSKDSGVSLSDKEVSLSDKEAMALERTLYPEDTDPITHAIVHNPLHAIRPALSSRIPEEHSTDNGTSVIDCRVEIEQ